MQLWFAPTAKSTAWWLLGSVRTVGSSEPVIAPVPICPLSFLPQHIISPADESAQA